MTELRMTLNAVDETRVAELKEKLMMEQTEDVVRWAIGVAYKAKDALAINEQRSLSHLLIFDQFVWSRPATSESLANVPTLKPGKGSMRSIISPLSPDAPDVGGDNIDFEGLGFRFP